MARTKKGQTKGLWAVGLVLLLVGGLAHALPVFGQVVASGVGAFTVQAVVGWLSVIFAVVLFAKMNRQQ
ncbi:MAG: hypothetical protein HY367_00195 [Candidatus Aenigmarchaeota archaeon]|nr:hypothetical protein [Candidatus Aenigmarchaeota archaeon]